MEYKPLFPWFGGKSRVSDIVWERFGDVSNYVEPFFGSGAVLFKRPAEPRIETVNDIDGYVANFWRAVQSDAKGVAEWADWPISECDLHARHLWLVQRKVGFTEQLISNPDFYDAKVAGWWVWGICQWIGSGWCNIVERPSRPRPHLSHNRGIHAPSRQMPHLGNAGRGIHRPSRQRPHLGNAGTGIHRPHQNIQHTIEKFQERLRNVRVCCGDWSRIIGPSPTTYIGTTGVFLDPPYTAESGRDMEIYAEDSGSVGHDVHAWAIKNGDNPKLRIAVCGYEGEYQWPDDWGCVAWKAAGGYGSQSSAHNNENATRERIWFSPHCLKPKLQLGLF